MSHTEERVRLRQPCPCEQGQVLLIFHLPTAEGEDGYFRPPDIVCAVCAKRYAARYRADPDRVELVPAGTGGDPSEGDVVTYLLEPIPRSHPEWVDHA